MTRVVIMKNQHFTWAHGYPWWIEEDHQINSVNNSVIDKEM